VSVYLDHAATTPMPDAIRETYSQALAGVGNPSSIHQAGQDARAQVESARAEIAGLMGLDPMELVFTSGGTESTNTWIKGRTFALRQQGTHSPVWLATGAEHHATLDALEWLEAHGLARTHFVDVDQWGVSDLGSWERALDAYPAEEIAGVTTLVANNEVGSIQPVEHIAALAATRGVSVHVDAIQAFGHRELPIRQWGVHAVSLSAHKIGGPVGIGALVVTRDAPAIEGLHHGGGQQLHRSGTLDAAGALAFAHAARFAESIRLTRESRLETLAGRLREGLVAAARGVHPSGHPTHRLHHIVHVTVDDVEGDVLLYLLDAQGIRVSTGSACQAGVPEPSHVLLAMGYSQQAARGALRFSLGDRTTDADIDRVVEVFPQVVSSAREAGMAGTSGLGGAPAQ